MPSLRALFVLQGAILGVFYPFVPVILAARGFAPAGVGLVAALSSLAFTVAVPVWGHVADVELGRVRTLRIAIVGSTVAVLALLAPLPMALAGLSIVVYAAFESAFQPLADALAINLLIAAGHADRYARVRLGASLGFSVATIAVGVVYDVTGYGPAPVLWAVLAAAMVVSLAGIPDIARARLAARSGDHAGPVRTRPAGGSFVYALRIQPRLVPVLAAIGLMHVGIVAGFTFLSLRLMELGGQPSDVALSAGLSAAAEVPTMFLMPRIVARAGVRATLVVAMVTYAACIAAWAVLTLPAAIIATRIVTGVAFAAIAVSSVMTVARLLPRPLQATGQGLLQTVAFGVAAVAANGLGGVVFGAFGAPTLFAAVSITALAAAAVTWRVIPGDHDDLRIPEVAEEGEPAAARG